MNKFGEFCPLRNRAVTIKKSIYSQNLRFLLMLMVTSLENGH